MYDERFFDYLIQQGVFTSTELEKYRQIFIERQKTEAPHIQDSPQGKMLEPISSTTSTPFSIQTATSFPAQDVSQNPSFFEIPLPPLSDINQTLPPESFLSPSQNEPLPLSDSLRSMVEHIDEFDRALNLGSDASLKIALPQERYEVLETLGQGGMGVVQRVLDRFLEREVALKKIKSSSKDTNNLSETQQWMKWRLRTEVSIMACLEHPNIVPLYDMQQTEKGEVFFTMRKIGGKTLSRLLEEKKDMLLRERDIRNPEEKEILSILLKNYSEPKLLGIFLKICDAVRYAHSKGIIHRDLKPENIMVGEFGEVYVMDWGIAKKRDREESVEPLRERKTDQIPLDPVQQTIGGMGTLGYMSPEQAENASQVTERTDLYSLGKILKQLYTLMSPMEESQWKTTQSPSEKEQISSPYLAKIPLDILAIVKNAIHENPRKRYKSVQLLLDDLDRYLTHTQISVREYSFWEALDKLRKRYQQKIKGVLILGISCCLLIIYFHFARQREIDFRLQEIFEKVQDEQTEASKISTGSLNKNKKLSHLLNALNSLDSAMILSERNPLVEERKVQVGKELIRWCCETGEYELADYLVKDLTKLLWLQQHPKILGDLQNQIITSKNQNLMQQQEQIHFWLKTLQQNPTQSDILEKAILEISKFQEEEVLKILLPLLKKGVDYFMNQEKRLQNEEHFYFALVTLLGEAKFTKSVALLEKALERLFAKRQLLRKPLEKNAQSELKMMILMARSLASLKEITSIPLLRKIYAEFGPFSYFYQETYPAYKIMLSHAISLEATSYDSERLASEKEAQLQRGILLYELHQYEQAAFHLNQVLQYKPIPIEAYHYLGLSYLELHQFDRALQAIQESLLLDPQHPFSYLIRGQIEERQEKNSEALADYSTAIQFNSGYAPAYIRRGHLYALMKNWPSALNDYSSTLHLNTELPDIYYSRGKIQSFLGRFEEAENDFTMAIQLNPSYELALLERGQVYYWRGNLIQSVKDFSQVLALNPSCREAYFHRGNIYYYQGNLNEALADYQTLLSFDVSQPVPYLLRIQVYLSQGDFTLARKDCESLLKLDLHNPQAHFYQGLLHLQDDQLLSAIQSFEHALQYDPYFLEAYLELGKALKKQQSWDRALNSLDSLLTLDPNYPEAYQERAEIHYHQKQWSAALKDYQKILHFFPENAEAYHWCAVLYLQQNQLQEAFENIQNALRLNPQQAHFYFVRGQIWNRQNQQSQALSDYQSAIDLDRQNASFYFERALLYFQQESWELARNDLDAVLKLLPEFIQAHYYRGRVYEQLGENERAISDYQKVITLDPDFLEAYLHRGDLLLNERDFSDAIKDFTKLIQNNSKSLHTYKKRIQAYLKINKPEEALKDCAAALALSPEDSELCFFQGEAFFLQKEIPKALFYYSLAIDRDPENISYYMERGHAYFKTESFSEAFQDYERVLQLHPEHEEACVNRGLILKAQGKFLDALNDFNQVIQKNPDYPYIFYFRGLTQVEIEDWDRAIEDFSEAILLSPEFSPAYVYRGHAYYQRGEIFYALEDYQKAQKFKEPFFRIFFFLGIYYYDQKNLEKAMDHFNQAILKHKSYVEAYYYRGLLFYEQNQIQKAFEEWGQALHFMILQPFFTKTNEKIILRIAEKYQQQQAIDVILQKFETRSFLPPDSPYPKQYFEIFATILSVRAVQYTQEKQWELAWNDILRYKQIASNEHSRQTIIQELQEKVKPHLPPK